MMQYLQSPKFTKIISFISFEISIQNHIYNLIKYLIIYFLFAVTSIALLNNQNDISKFGVIFLIIFYPIALMSFAGLIFKNDLEDGYLENLLCLYNPIDIILAKYVALNICGIISLFFNITFAIIVFNIMTLDLIFNLIISLLLLIILTSAMLILIGTSVCYFRSSSNFLALIILPLLIPSIITTGLIFLDPNNQGLKYMLFGIDLALVPISLILSSYLLKNIYNI